MEEIVEVAYSELEMRVYKCYTNNKRKSYHIDCYKGTVRTDNVRVRQALWTEMLEDQINNGEQLKTELVNGTLMFTCKEYSNEDFYNPEYFI
mgnify:CR=1 FL=1